MAVKASPTGISLRGQQGEVGPSGVPYINFPNANVGSWGPLGLFKATSLTINNIFVFDAIGGNLMPVLIRPLRDMSLAYLNLTNTNSSAGSISPSLRNYANDQAVYVAGAIVRNSTFNNGPFAPGLYPLLAGQTYYFGAQPSASGNYTAWITAQFHNPSGASCATSAHPTFQLLPSMGGLLNLTPSTLSTTPAYMHPPNMLNGTTQTFQINTPGYVSNVQFVNLGSGTATFALQNTTSNTLVWQGPAVTANGAFMSGHLPPSTIPLAAGVRYAWYVTGSGSMAQNLTMHICQ